MKTAYFDYIGSLDLPAECVTDCSRQGRNDDAVEYWRSILNLQIDPDKLRKELMGHGAWDTEELSDHDANLERIIWIASHSINEEEN